MVLAVSHDIILKAKGILIDRIIEVFASNPRTLKVLCFHRLKIMKQVSIPHVDYKLRHII